LNNFFINPGDTPMELNRGPLFPIPGQIL